MSTDPKENTTLTTPRPSPRFFGRGPTASKKIFEELLVQALTLIESNKSPVAKQILDIIKAKKVVFRSFQDVTQTHFLEIFKRHFDKENQALFPCFPPSKKAVEYMESNLEGLFFPKNTIYLKANPNAFKLAKTIIHEVTHFINEPIYSKDRKTIPDLVAWYKDEIRSHSAELLFKKNDPLVFELSPKEHEKICEKIKERYVEFASIGAKKFRVD